VKIKIWIAYCLLLSFFVLVTPRTLWHNCEHDEHQVKKENNDGVSKIKSSSKSCFTCEFDLGFVDQPNEIVSFSFLKFFALSSDKPIITNSSLELLLPSKRGPPTV